ncbi:MAG: hypothetical protein ACOX9R_14510 [Armatimonadota bacterium]|jgi:hypothetical protein
MTTSFDFSRSFATFTTAGRSNNARIQVEAVCEMAGGSRYVLVASCKAEDTYAERDLFRTPNYDFCAIFSEEQYCIVRVGLPVTACWRDTGLNADRFDAVAIALAEADADECVEAREIVEATLANRRLVGRTELLGEAGESVARLSYPIKTINVNDPASSPGGDWIYQVDTGPIIVPDPRRQAERAVEALDLAFIAWNARGWGELIVLTPTRLNHSDDCAGHYSRISPIATRNEIFALA